ncbi:MAG: TIGR02680 family protein [Gemmatimonadetes bacterium]|nr:TIGR02680 family protein [Gemmatimonadota bacterium]
MMQSDFFRLGGTPPRMLQLLDGMHASDPDRWMPRRLILQNYWLFHEPEVFHFARGNLMLTGQNESGKSTVLVTAITLVLDMMLTPDRVDTMGSNDRSIRYYLIGKDDAPPDNPHYHRERTAYIALEFERGASGVYHTIGIGLRSSRDFANQKVERWGFVMDGARRVEVDFHLYDGDARQPLRPGALRNRLGRAGQVFDDQRAYKSAVNEALFGFQTVEDYERFLEMLHVVRTPKLGEGLNPKKVEAYLKESLPPIQAAAIDGASEVFSRLDTIEMQLDHVRQQLAKAGELEAPQEALVLASARVAAAAYRESAREYRDRKKAHARVLSQLESARAEVARQEDVRKALASERAEAQGVLRVRQDQHRLSEAFDIEARLAEVRGEQADAEAAYEALRADRQRTQKSLDREQEQLRDSEQSWTRQRGRLGEKLESVAGAARRAFWPSLEQRAALARDALPGQGVDGGGTIASDLARSAIDGEAQQRRGVLSTITSAMDALSTAGGRLDDARKASDVARREYSQADDRFRTAGREADSARSAAAAALGAWRDGCVGLRVPDEEFGAVLGVLESYEPQGRRPASVLAPLQPVADAALEEVRDRMHEARLQQRRVQDEAHEVDLRLKRLAAEPDVEPDRSPAQASARRLLREHAIPHVPLFAASDLGALLVQDAALAARTEAALLDAGLLDALIVPASRVAEVRSLLDGHGLGDRWIAPSASGWADGRGSADWLTPVASAEVAVEDIRTALHALGLSGGGDAVVGASGAWRLGPLHGLAAAPVEARVRFLGETARREERQRRIEEARRQLAELRERLGEIGEEIETLQSRERLIAREWRAAQELPQLQAVHDRLLTSRQAEHERERRRGIAEMAAETVETATRDVQQRTAALDRATDDAPYLKGRARAEIEAVGAALAEVLAVVRAIGEDVERMEEIRRTYAARTRALDDLRHHVEELAPRIAQADVRVQTLDSQIRVLAAQLETANVGREELAAEIERLQRRLIHIGEQDEAARRIIDRNTGSIERMVSEEPDYADQARRALIRRQTDEVEFRARLDAYPTLDEYARAARETGLDRAMQMVLSDVSPESIEEEAKQARDALQRAFVQASPTFEELSPSLDGDIIRFTHEQGPMRLDELYRTLEEEQARNETLLEDEDRKLIEQLMLRDVVDAIRDAIRNTRRWVEDINGILGRMQLFKGGIMRLHWEVRPRGDADAFEPRRLDDLLSQRGIALDETRREELLEIFRTMVSDIRRRSRENQLHEDYRTALLRMVDYTQWYSLTVQRKDDSGRWMPLTRRLYGQGSGGRRTLDLLLPLIAAVSARLSSADRAAPRLVGFDEAFAGVDDRNAAEIYGLLSELGFCWIMATEKATGLGPEVRGSATYEMLTDGDTVAPTLSIWDGARRYEFIGDELLGITASLRTEMEAADAS